MAKESELKVVAQVMLPSGEIKTISDMPEAEQEEVKKMIAQNFYRREAERRGYTVSFD